MKTLKLIIAGIAIATLAYSCSNDRDDESRKEAIDHVKNSNPELKLNPGQLSKDGDLQIKADSIIIKSLNSGPDDPIDPIDPNEGGDPKNLPPRK